MDSNVTIKRIKAIHNGMLTRCYNKNSKDFSRYGGRGIKVCDRCRGKNGKQNFVEWALRNGYNDSLTIDRIDGAKGYMPSNCRWATVKEQNSNRTNNHLIEFRGEKKTLQEWSDLYGASKAAIRHRIRHGWPIEDAIITPTLKRGERIHYGHG